MTTVSVALATFNGQKFLKEQLQSLAAQTVPITELIVCDDGSVDDTITILRNFAARAPFPVQIINNTQRLGYRANFIKAAASCSGDLIAFCDQDDVWHAQKLETVIPHFSDASVLLVYHDATLTNEDRAPVVNLFGPRKTTFEPLAIRPWLIVPGLVQTFRRTLLRFTVLHNISKDPYSPREKMPHDLWYLFLASIFGKIVYVPERLVEYRQHDANTSGWPHPYWSDYVRDNITNAEKYSVANVVSSANRVSILERARESASADELLFIEAAISLYTMLQTVSQLRAEIYRSQSLVERARLIYELLMRGAYTRSGPASLGLDTLLLDLGVGLPFSRYGRQNKKTELR